jgi:catechol 2,3-dioxygenase-like lactoylglutathione lyase family enzyme
MKRLHIHVAVKDLEAGLRYYTTLFATEPVVRHDDYAKWSLEDPAVNFAISARGAAEGVDHLGIQVDSEEALADFTTRLENAGAPALREEDANCCYARAEKTWSRDPSGVVWETFFTHGTSDTFGKDAPKLETPKSACCAPETE